MKFSSKFCPSGSVNYDIIAVGAAGCTTFQTADRNDRLVWLVGTRKVLHRENVDCTFIFMFGLPAGREMKHLDAEASFPLVVQTVLEVRM